MFERFSISVVLVPWFSGLLMALHYHSALRTVYPVELPTLSFPLRSLHHQTQSLSLRFTSAVVANLIPARRAIISGVELAIIRIFRIRIVGRRALGFIQGVGSLVLFPHAVDDEHHHQYGAEQADNGSANDSCW